MKTEEQKLKKELRETETQLGLLNQKKEQIEFRIAIIRQEDRKMETTKENFVGYWDGRLWTAKESKEWREKKWNKR